jgi:hypothetical protein
VGSAEPPGPPGSPPAAEAALVEARATAGWLRGDVIQALVAATELDREVYRVRGLDEDGHPASAGEKAFGALFTESAGEYVAVRGDRPDCAAVGLYRALAAEHTWLVVTSHRVAVLRLDDRAAGTEQADALEAVKQERSLGGALRGLGKLVKASATEFARSVGRPPLAERPGDAVLVPVFEVPRQALAGVERWKQPLVPQFRGGPRWLQVHFTDGSWARVKTDEAGQAALTAGDD